MQVITVMPSVLRLQTVHRIWSQRWRQWLGRKQQSVGQHTSSSSSQSGFTLVELMVVMGIVALLAAAAVPQFQNYAMRARWAKNVASISALQTAVGACLASNAGDATACDSMMEVGVTPVLPHALDSNPSMTLATVDSVPTVLIGMVGSDDAGGCEVRAELPVRSDGVQSMWTLKRDATSPGQCNVSSTGISETYEPA